MFIDSYFNYQQAITYEHLYTMKTLEYMRRLGLQGYIIVFSYASEKIPLLTQVCGIACSIGLNGFGIIFLSREILYNPKISSELKEFIIAHEVAHIVRSHTINRILIRTLFTILLQLFFMSIENLVRSKKPLETLLYLITIVMQVLGMVQTIKIDINVIKMQELEADAIATYLTGCRVAQRFLEWLSTLYKSGVFISHVAVLGLPALTMEERINNIKLLCLEQPYVYFYISLLSVHSQ